MIRMIYNKLGKKPLTVFATLTAFIVVIYKLGLLDFIIGLIKPVTSTMSKAADTIKEKVK